MSKIKEETMRSAENIEIGAASISAVPAVELKQVSFKYEGAPDPVLQNVDFALHYGEIVLLSGDSGEGKSTVLGLISGIIPNVTSGEVTGEIEVDGSSVRGRKLAEICRKVGVVLQNADAQIIQKLVEDEIAFGCENFAMEPPLIRSQIQCVCRLMQLDPADKTRTLSGGQKQRLVTASTLATGQRILVLDEPLANLDGANAAHLMSTLRALAKAGYAVLIIEHRLDRVLPFVDRVWHLGGGNVQEIKDKDTFLQARSVRIPDIAALHPTGKTLYRLENITVSFGSRSVLNGVDLEIYEGERLLLLGENGAGKTTLCRVLSRLTRPTSGKFTQWIDPKARRAGKRWFFSVGVVYQNPNYQLFMPTVEREISFQAYTPEYAEKMLRLFGLESIRERHPQSLSEGQKRLVSIAAVLAGRPRVLLLDEPTVGQDYAGLKTLIRILNDVHEESGNTMITITHDVRCAAALTDRALLLQGGKITEQGGKDFVNTYFQTNNTSIQKSPSA